jgi:hypothetical protein
MYSADWIVRYGIVKSTLIFSLICVLFSFITYLIIALITDLLHPVGLFMSFIVPAIVVPPICMRQLRLTQLLYRARKDLLMFQEELEKRVAERTLELSNVNEQLKNEIQERKRAEQYLQENEERYRFYPLFSGDKVRYLL